MLKIIGNGSKWAGQDPDPVSALIERLHNYPLNRDFEEYGNFISDCRGAVPHGRTKTGKQIYLDTGPIHPEAPNAVRFFGNFFNLSAVFTIDTDDAEIIKTLTKAIRANQKRPDYLSQPKPKKSNRYITVTE